MGRYESPQLFAEESLILASLAAGSMSLPSNTGLLGSAPAATAAADYQPGLTVALLAPAGSSALGTFTPRQLPSYNPWASNFEGLSSQLSLEQQQSQGSNSSSSSLHAEPLCTTSNKLGPTNSRLGNLQFSSSSNGHHALTSLPLVPPQHCGTAAFPSKFAPGLCSSDSFGALDGGCGGFNGAGAGVNSRNNSPYRGTSTFISSFRAAQQHQELRGQDSSASSSPFGSYAGSPRAALDFRAKRASGTSTTGVSSPRTPPHGAGGHRIGIDPRLVVGSPLEIAWEVLHQNPGLAALLNLQPNSARLLNLSVQEDDEPEPPPAAECAASAAGREPGAPLNPEQLVHEQGLVRSCRGLPARVRDDLIKAARLAVTRRDSSGRELPGTGLLPFFWRVQSNLKWLLQQPATLKGQLLPGQIDFITEEQRGLSFQKTVQQRARLGELAVMLHSMLQPEGRDEAAPGGCAAAAGAHGSAC